MPAIATIAIAACANPSPASAPAADTRFAGDKHGDKPDDKHGDMHPDKHGDMPDDIIDLGDLDGTIALDIRYATADNFTGVAVYPVARCLLRREVAERLVRVHKALHKRGLGLKVWDCYRPISVQQRFWELVPDPRYVARPVIADGVPRQGSRHNRGAAVDLTLVDARGVELTMPTAHDDFSARAHRSSNQHSPTARRNMSTLQHAMEAEGFLPLATEWWHFDAPDWRRYPLSDFPMQRE